MWVTASNFPNERQCPGHWKGKIKKGGKFGENHYSHIYKKSCEHYQFSKIPLPSLSHPLSTGTLSLLRKALHSNPPPTFTCCAQNDVTTVLFYLSCRRWKSKCILLSTNAWTTLAQEISSLRTALTTGLAASLTKWRHDHQSDVIKGSLLQLVNFYGKSQNLCCFSSKAVHEQC